MMALFGLRKREKREKPVCCGAAPRGITSIKVLGTGCRLCHEQYDNCRTAIAELGMQLEVEYITDMEKILSYGVMNLPGIVVNDRVVSAGQVLKAADVIRLLQKQCDC